MSRPKPTGDFARQLIETKRVGDVVRLGGKPHYLYSINPDHVTLVSMDERKMLVTLWDKRDGT